MNLLSHMLFLQIAFIFQGEEFTPSKQTINASRVADMYLGYLIKLSNGTNISYQQPSSSRGLVTCSTPFISPVPLVYNLALGY